MYLLCFLRLATHDDGMRAGRALYPGETDSATAVCALPTPTRLSFTRAGLVPRLLLLPGTAFAKGELLRNPGAVGQVGKQSIVGKIERVRVLPVVACYACEALHHFVISHLDR